jgi:hypothetical protein
MSESPAMQAAAESPSSRVSVGFLACAVIALGALEGHARPDFGQPIHVAARSGEVAVTMRGAPRDVRPGSAVELPAHIITGPIGRLRLEQAETAVAIAGNTEVEIPVAAAAAGLIARIVQVRGNVLYDGERREGGGVRVDTPYLVAVVKGTQFNVAVQGESTTVSLFEGRLEVRSPDGDHVVELEPGEIAIRAAGDQEETGPFVVLENHNRADHSFDASGTRTDEPMSNFSTAARKSHPTSTKGMVRDATLYGASSVPMVAKTTVVMAAAKMM